MHTGCIQGAYRVHTVCILSAYRVHTGYIQCAYGVHTGCIQSIQCAYRVHTECVHECHMTVGINVTFFLSINNLIFLTHIQCVFCEVET